MMKLFASVILLAFIPASVFGIKCFVCFHSHPKHENVGQDLDCKTPQPKYLQECTEYSKLPGQDHADDDEEDEDSSSKKPSTDKKQFSCGSLVGYNTNRTNVAVRYCQKKAADDYRREELSGGKVGFSHVCNTDGCNDFTLSNAPVIDIAVISNHISASSAYISKAAFSVIFVCILVLTKIL